MDHVRVRACEDANDLDVIELRAAKFADQRRSAHAGGRSAHRALSAVPNVQPMLDALAARG